MPPPIKVELVAHNPAWAPAAEAEAARLVKALGSIVVAIHHIGSTAVAGIHAKPILDLMPEVHGLAALDAAVPLLESLGYQCWGEYGISGRRYCTLNDPSTRARRIQLHGYQSGHPEIRRHLAFRDYLRRHPEKAAEYDADKQRCRAAHPDDSHAYTDAKAAWIEANLPQALSEYQAEIPATRSWKGNTNRH